MIKEVSLNQGEKIESKSETVKLILKGLANQYSLKEVINCVFSYSYKNKEIKNIIDFLIQEEGKLKIVQYLLHLGDNIDVNEIKEIEEIKENKEIKEIKINEDKKKNLKELNNNNNIIFNISSSPKSKTININNDNNDDVGIIKEKEKDTEKEKQKLIKIEEYENIQEINLLKDKENEKDKIKENEEKEKEKAKLINKIKNLQKTLMPNLDINSNTNNNINDDLNILNKYKYNNKETTIELTDNNKKKEEDICIIDEINEQKLKEKEKEKEKLKKEIKKPEEKILEINIEFNKDNKGNKDKIIQLTSFEESETKENKSTKITTNKEIKEIKETKEKKEKEGIKEGINIISNLHNLILSKKEKKIDENISLSSSDDGSGIQIQEEKFIIEDEPPKNDKNMKTLESVLLNKDTLDDKTRKVNGNNVNDYLSKKRLNKDKEDNSNVLKYYYFLDNGKFYKYKIKEENIGIANLICDDNRCNGKGIYIMNNKMFNVVSKHNILNSEHNYVKNMTKSDKNYIENMKKNKQSGLEVTVQIK